MFACGRRDRKPRHPVQQSSAPSPAPSGRVPAARWPLRDALPVSGRVRLITTQPASVEAHTALVALGFEGTVLKRPRSAYRPGRQSAWVKHKARCGAQGILLSVHQDRDGQWQAICNVEGRRVRALAGARSSTLIGRPVSIVYSRVDAGGGLREARLASLPLGC